MNAGTGLRRQAATGVRWTLVASVTSTAAQLVQLVVLGRVLAPTAFGLMAMVLVVTGFVQAYTDLGLSSALVYRTDATSEQLSSLYWLNLAAGLAAALVVWCAAPLLLRTFEQPQIVPLVRAASAVLVLAAVGRQFEVLLQRDLEFRRLAMVDASAAAGGAITAIGLAVAGAGVWALVGGLLANAAVKACALAAVGVARYRPAPHFRFADVRSFLGFGLYQVGERSVNYVAERADQYIVGALLGATALGYYGFAFNLVSQPVSRINPIVTKVAYPTLARVRGDAARLRRGFLEMSRLLTTVNAPVLVGLALVAPSLVVGVFGDKWAESVRLVQLLSLVALLRSIGNPVGSLQLALGRADLGFKWNVLVLVLGVPAVYAGAVLGGLHGIAAALLGLTLVLLCLSYPLLVRPLLGPSGAAYAAAVLRPMAHVAVMAAAVLAVELVLPALPPLVVAAVQVGVGAAVYVASLAAFERPLLGELRGLVAARA